ncbi:hypothetical protein [Halanaerobaculum tunisiense]
MLRHLLLGIGISLLVISLVMLRVDVVDNSSSNQVTNNQQYKSQTIIKEAKKLGMTFPGTDYSSEVSLEQKVDLDYLRAPAVNDQTSQEQISITIAEGMRGNQVARLLVEQGLVAEERVFIKLLAKFDIEDRIMAGEYHFSPSVSPFEVLLTLTAN